MLSHSGIKNAGIVGATGCSGFRSRGELMGNWDEAVKVVRNPFWLMRDVPNPPLDREVTRELFDSCVRGPSEEQRLLDQLADVEADLAGATDEDHRRIERCRQAIIDRLNALRIEKAEGQERAA